MNGNDTIVVLKSHLKNMWKIENIPKTNNFGHKESCVGASLIWVTLRWYQFISSVLSCEPTGAIIFLIGWMGMIQLSV